jgi:glycyl-tRNA synthetase alpha chain
MEITQYTYFQQVAGYELSPITVELTYGLERLAMYLQKVDHFLDLTWVEGIKYRDVYFRNETEQSKFNFEQSRPELLFQWFAQYAEESRRLCGENLPLPAYDYCMKCSHTFNLLDARGAISVAERAQYIKRVRDLALLCAQTFVGEAAP